MSGTAARKSLSVPAARECISLRCIRRLLLINAVESLADLLQLVETVHTAA
jgi:hypothetical protein